MTLRLSGVEIMNEGGLRRVNQEMLSGLTVTSTAEAAQPAWTPVW